MKQRALFIVMTLFSVSLCAANDDVKLQQEIERLQQQTQQLQSQINRLQTQVAHRSSATKKTTVKSVDKHVEKSSTHLWSASLYVRFIPAK